MADVCATDPYVLKGQTTSLSQGEGIAMLVTFIVCLTWTTAHLVVFLSLKKRYARTKLRVAVYSVIYYFGVLLFAVGFILPLVTGWQNWPCWLEFFLTCSCVACFNATNFTRGTVFMLMTRLSYATFQFGRISVDATNAAEEKYAKMSRWSRFRDELGWIRYGFRFIFITDAVKVTNNREDHLKTLLALRFIASTRGSLMFALVVMSPWFAILITFILAVPTYRLGCTGCPPDHDPLVYMMLSLGVMVFLFAAIFAIRCRNMPDVWGVFKESRLSAVGVFVSGLTFTIGSCTPYAGRYYAYIFTALAWAVGFAATTSLQVYLGWRQAKVNPAAPGSAATRSKKTNKTSQIESSEARDSLMSLYNGSPCADLKACPRLNEILKEGDMARAFELHLSIEFGLENLYFLLDVFDWKMAFHDVPRSAAFARARKLFSTYISIEGLNQVNIPSWMYKEVEQHLAKGESELTPQTFDKVRHEIAKLLESGAVMRFIKSDEYIKMTSANAVINAVA